MARPFVMGVLNVTPDSFYDGGLYLDQQAAVRRGREILDEGADILDIGGESTRPGACPVSEDEELGRVLPVVESLARDERVASRRARISIDTTTPGVALAATAAGATMVNDVSASLAEVAAETGAAFVAMHAKGSPAHMQDDPCYDDVVAEVSDFLADRARAAQRAGVSEVWVDPGIGFGKTARHNLALLSGIGELAGLGWPLLVGTSRKTFLGRLVAGGPDAAPAPLEERFEGSLATAVWSMARGAAAVRVHDVRATVQAARLIAATRGDAGSPARAGEL
ncbi:MAG: dihydropteroate synthase [Acidimicrobiales bacterium]